MQTKRYKPYFDKLYLITALPVFAIISAMTILTLLTSIYSFFLFTAVDIFILFFLISPFFGYAELREDTLFIKYGLIMRKEIPYEKIRGASIGRKYYSESMLSLKNSIEHISIKYNAFDTTEISVITNEEFLSELEKRIS